jgi:CP family cyanate transporter-like MFS transporter
MRTQLVAVGPLLPQMRADLGIPYAVGGLLVTLPVLCMGVVAVPAALVADRFGAVAAITACAVVLASGGLARALAPDAALLIVLTLPIGVAIGLGGALLPAVARERAPNRPSIATGAYVTGFVLGSTSATMLAVPLADALGSWRMPLALFGIVTIGLSFVWWWVTRVGPSHVRRGARLPSLPWRRPVAWLLVAVFGLQSLLFFGLVTWLPAYYVEQGMDPATAGFTVGVFIAVGLPSTVLAAWLGEGRIGHRELLIAAAVSTLAAIVGTITVPDAALVWALLAGVGLGILFPVSLTLPLDIAPDARALSGYIGLMLGVGYLLSATAPFVLGAVRDAAGSFAASLWLLVAVAVVAVVAAAFLSPARVASERAVGEPAKPMPAPR